MKKSSIETILNNYREAYQQANKRPIEVTYKNGWVSIGAGWHVHKKRLREIPALTGALRCRSSKQQSET